jgi:hypothetical protein
LLTVGEIPKFVIDQIRVIRGYLGETTDEEHSLGPVAFGKLLLSDQAVCAL